MHNVDTREEEKILKAIENNVGSGVFTEFNKAYVFGIVEKDFEFNHEEWGERFYVTRVRVARLSKTEDLVPIMISNRLVKDVERPIKGKCIEVAGQFRSHNTKDDEGRSHLGLALYATSISIHEESAIPIFKNIIFLDGYICKQPTYKVTKLGRKITDVMLAVNRPKYRMTDYIPCIAWGKTAKIISYMTVGNRIQLYGRIQSREYYKKINDRGEGEYRVAYEISLSSVASEPSVSTIEEK